MAYDADAAIELERLRILQRQRHSERMCSGQPAIKMIVGEWYVDELGMPTREIKRANSGALDLDRRFATVGVQRASPGRCSSGVLSDYLTKAPLSSEMKCNTCRFDIGLLTKTLGRGCPIGSRRAPGADEHGTRSAKHRANRHGRPLRPVRSPAVGELRYFS
jgi:hypothetical protein